MRLFYYVRVAILLLFAFPTLNAEDDLCFNSSYKVAKVNKLINFLDYNVEIDNGILIQKYGSNLIRLFSSIIPELEVKESKKAIKFYKKCLSLTQDIYGETTAEEGILYKHLALLESKNGEYKSALEHIKIAFD